MGLLPLYFHPEKWQAPPYMNAKQVKRITFIAGVLVPIAATIGTLLICAYILSQCGNSH